MPSHFLLSPLLFINNVHALFTWHIHLPPLNSTHVKCLSPPVFINAMKTFASSMVSVGLEVSYLTGRVISQLHLQARSNLKWVSWTWSWSQFCIGPKKERFAPVRETWIFVSSHLGCTSNRTSRNQLRFFVDSDESPRRGSGFATLVSFLPLDSASDSPRTKAIKFGF